MKTHNLRASLQVLLALLFAVCTFPGLVSAQAYRGAIKGEVLDTQKASVPGAQVTLRNERTGVTASTTSGSSGQFSFLNLSPGTYSLTTRAKGFSPSTLQHIAVDVGRTLAFTVTLQPGTLQQTITVSANLAAVDTQTSAIATVVTPQAIKDLPLPMSGDMRNPLSFVLLTPGVYGSTPGATPDYRLHVSGAASYSNDVYIDGIPDANPNLPGDIGNTHPPLGAISEFKIINNNESARYGFSSSIVSFAFKSGTNQYHGSLFEYLQNDVFNAAGFVANALGQKKPPLKQNEFGGTFGGPVRIPHIYDGHNRTFFFVDYTGFKWRPSSANASLTTIPNLYRTGDFSQSLGPQLTVDGQPLFDPAGRPVYQGEIYNPFSVHTVVGPDGKSYQLRDPFPGNIIPPGFAGLSSASEKILPFFPKADNNALFNNLVRNQFSKTDEHRLVVKIDEHISENHSLSGSLFLGGFGNSNNGGLNLLDATTNTDPTTQIRLNYNYVPSPTVVNNLNLGFLRDNAFSGPLQPGPGLAALGITGLPALAKDSPFPLISLGTLINSIGTTAGGASAAVANRFIVNDNVTIIRGAHSFSFGGDLRRLQLNNGGIPSGNFTFEQTQTALNGTEFINGNQAVSIPDSTGNPVASFLFGGMDYSHFDYPIPQYYRWLQSGLYAQDDWRVTPDLTLNLGLRWDLQVPRTEKYGNVSSVNPTLPNPAAGGLPGAYWFYGMGLGRNGRPRIGNVYYGGFQPRVGFAYSPGAEHKTVFRGGFGIFRPIGNDNLQGGFTGGYNAGFAGLANVNRPQDYVGSPAYYWDNPYPPSGISLPNSNLSPSTLTGNDNSIWIAPNVGLPPSQLYWSAQIQRQISRSMVATVGYIGMHTYHLGLWAKPNQVNPALAQQRYSAAAAAGLPLNEFLALPITDPRVVAAGITPPWPGFVALMGPAATLSQALRPFPQYGDVDHPEDPIGSVSYNGLQASLQKRFSQGLTVQAAQELQKFLMPVPLKTLPDDSAFEYLQGCKQRRCAVALIVMRHRTAAPFFQGQTRLRAIQSLHLALLVHPNHHRLLRRVQIKPDRIGQLFQKPGITGELNMLHPVRLEIVTPPNVADRGSAHSLALGHLPTTPVGHPRRLGLQCRVHHRFDLLGPIGRLAPASGRRPPQAFQTSLRKTRAPQAHRLAIDSQLFGDTALRFAFGRRQNTATCILICWTLDELGW